MEQQHNGTGNRQRSSGQSRPQRRPSQQRQPQRSGGAHAAPQRTRRPAQQQEPYIGAHAAPPRSSSGQAPRRRPPADGQRRPQQRPVQNRSAQRPAQNRPAQRTQNPQRSAAYRSSRPNPQRRPVQGQYRGGNARSRARAQAVPTRGSRNAMFVIFLILYIIVGILVIRSVMKKARVYLAEYEASRPQYKIGEYVSNLDSDFYSKMIRQAVEHLEINEYETPAGIMKALAPDDLNRPAEYTYVKAENFSDSKPSYYLLRNEKAVATLGLDRSGWTAKYSFPEWSVEDPVSVMQIDAQPVYKLSVTMPKGSYLYVNGKRVQNEMLTETESELQLTNTELNFMKQPVSVKCVIEGLYAPPVVEVTDAGGIALAPETVPKPDEPEQIYLFAQADERDPDPDLLARAEELTKAYIEYVANKDTDRFNNLAKLNNYLLPGSDAANLMQMIVNDVYWNNPYSMRTDKVLKAEHLKMYSEKLCTCDVRFDISLTKQVTNEYIASARWVMVNNGYGWYATRLELLPVPDEAEQTEETADET